MRRFAVTTLLASAIATPLFLGACSNDEEADAGPADQAEGANMPGVGEPSPDAALANSDAAGIGPEDAVEPDPPAPIADAGDPAASAAELPEAAAAEAPGDGAADAAPDGDEAIDAAGAEPIAEPDLAPVEADTPAAGSGGPALEPEATPIEAPDGADAPAVEAGNADADMIEGAGDEPPAADEGGPTVAHISEPIEAEAEFLALVEAGDQENGRRLLLRCGRCHSIREDDFESERLGPPLFDIVGADIGRADFYDYSDALLALNDDLMWTVARLNAFIADPTGTLPGTTMEVTGVDDEQDRADVIAHLLTLAPEPEPEAGDPEIVEALLTRIAEADVAEGAILADALCARCHSFDDGGETIVGPNLHDVVGHPVGGVDAFTYSASMRSLNEEGAAWSYVRLDTFLETPVLAIPGTRMGFSGVADPVDRAAIIAYLRTLSDAPVPLDNNIAIAADPIGNGLLPLVFTEEQVEAGREAYGREDCLSCHGRSLTGVVDVREAGVGMGTALVGINFESRWFDGPVLDLFRYTQRAMPIGEAGTLSDETYILILAYIFSENGFAWGDEPLPTDREALRQMGFYQLP